MGAAGLCVAAVLALPAVAAYAQEDEGDGGDVGPEKVECPAPVDPIDDPEADELVLELRQLRIEQAQACAAQVEAVQAIRAALGEPLPVTVRDEVMKVEVTNPTEAPDVAPVVAAVNDAREWAHRDAWALIGALVGIVILALFFRMLRP